MKMTANEVPNYSCTTIIEAGSAPADLLFHHHPAAAVNGVMIAAYKTIHAAALCSDARFRQRPSRSLKNASGSSAAVKLTRIG